MGKTQLANVEVPVVMANPAFPPPALRHPVIHWICDVVCSDPAVFAHAVASAFVEMYTSALRLVVAELRPGVRQAVVEVPVLHPDAAHFHGRPHIFQRLQVAVASWVIFTTILCAVSITPGQVLPADTSLNSPATYVAINHPAEAISGLAVAANAEVLNAVVAGINMAAAEADCEAKPMYE